jgi:hypothetical protein
VNQLYNLPSGKKKGIFSAFSSSPVNHTLFKIIYSIFPSGSFYKIPPLFDEGVKYSEHYDIDSSVSAPIFLDGTCPNHNPSVFAPHPNSKPNPNPKSFNQYPCMS